VTVLLQVLVIYLVTSLTIAVGFAIAAGRAIRRGDRRREHEVAVLARSRTVRAVDSGHVSPLPPE